MSKMNPEIKAKWIAALRSGEYEQRRTWLCVDGLYCCLGVLCDLAVKDGVDLSVGTLMDVRTYDDNTNTLPFKVQIWSGINSDLGDYSGGALSRGNDNGKSFSEIADIIETYF